MDRSSRRKINKETQALNDILDQIDLTDIIEYSIQKQQNIHSPQVHTEHSPVLITCWATVNLRKLKPYQVSFLNML